MRPTSARLAVIIAVLNAAPAIAQPLNPNNFSTIAATFAPTSVVTINTSTLQITGSGFTTVTGVAAAQANGGPTLAVFDFGLINIPTGVIVSVTGTRPFALLSQGGATVAGTINLSGGIGAGAAGSGVAGGGNGGSPPTTSFSNGLSGTGSGGGSGGTSAGSAVNGAGGGGFGGNGGNGGSLSGSGNGLGGGLYGNLLSGLQAGSGGGGGSSSDNFAGSGGGAGGGTMQLGAINAVTVSGMISANGGSVATANYGNNGGGGSGGGILITGNQILIPTGSIVSVVGGNGGYNSNNVAGSGAGGGGGGGIIALAPSVFTVGDVNNGQLFLAGGNGGAGGSTGATAGQAGIAAMAATQVVIPAAQSLTMTTGIVTGYASFSAGSYTVAGSLTLTNSSQTVSTLTGAGSVALTSTTLTVGAGDASGTFSGNITGNGGITKIGLGTLTLTGTGNTFSGGLTVSAGTVQGAVASLPAAITDNGNVAFNESETVTYSGTITGAGTLTKLGAGNLTLNGSQGYSGGTIVGGGTLSVSADSSLGAAGAPVTIQPLGSLAFTGTTTTTRTFILYGSTLVAGAGAVVTFNGATIANGFLGGPGTLTLTGGTAVMGTGAQVNATVNVAGVASLTNFSNSGALTIAAGLASPVVFGDVTNQGSGTITVGANSSVNASDFQTYGVVTLANGSGLTKTLLTNTGTTPLYFNGGSRTFIGTIGGNGQAQIELNGQNAIVAGGLFVNNGHVTDNSPAGVSTIIADYGALVKGVGQYDNSPITQNGGKFQAGNSPGLATFGRFVFGPGGVSNYVFAIDDATGQAGPTPDALGHVSGWGLAKAAQWQRSAGMTSGDFAWTADATNKLTFAIETLVNPTTAGTDVAGLMADFDPTRSYSWPAVEWTGAYSGPTDVAALDAATNFDTSEFANPIDGSFGWSLSNSSLSLSYTPSAVPEPGTLALVGIASAGFLIRRARALRRRSAS